MTKVIEIPGMVGNIVIYKDGDKTAISNGLAVDIKVDGGTLEHHTTRSY